MCISPFKVFDIDLFPHHLKYRQKENKRKQHGRSLHFHENRQTDRCIYLNKWRELQRNLLKCHTVPLYEGCCGVLVVLEELEQVAGQSEVTTQKGQLTLTGHCAVRGRGKGWLEIFEMPLFHWIFWRDKRLYYSPAVLDSSSGAGTPVRQWKKSAAHRRKGRIPLFTVSTVMEADTPDLSLRWLSMRGGRQEVEEEEKQAWVIKCVKMFTTKALPAHMVTWQPHPSVCSDTVEYKAAAALTSSTSPPPMAPAFKSGQIYTQNLCNTCVTTDLIKCTMISHL